MGAIRDQLPPVTTSAVFGNNQQAGEPRRKIWANIRDIVMFQKTNGTGNAFIHQQDISGRRWIAAYSAQQFLFVLSRRFERAYVAPLFMVESGERRKQVAMFVKRNNSQAARGQRPYIGLDAPGPRIDSTRSRPAKTSGALRNFVRCDACDSERPDSSACNRSRSLSGRVASELSA